MAPSFGMSSCFFSSDKRLLRKKRLQHRKIQKPPNLHSVILKNEAKIKKMHVFLHFSSEKFCQFKKKQYLCTRFRKGRTNNPGAVVQLVRISACHAGGRGFESRPHRKSLELRLEAFVCVCGRRTRTLPQGPPKISDFWGKEEQRGIDGAAERSHPAAELATTQSRPHRKSRSFGSRLFLCVRT